MLNILKKIFKIIIDILTLLIFLLLIIIIIAKVKMMGSNKDYPEMFGYSVFSVATGFL